MVVDVPTPIHDVDDVVDTPVDVIDVDDAVDTPFSVTEVLLVATPFSVTEVLLVDTPFSVTDVELVDTPLSLVATGAVLLVATAFSLVVVVLVATDLLQFLVSVWLPAEEADAQACTARACVLATDVAVEASPMILLFLSYSQVVVVIYTHRHAEK